MQDRLEKDDLATLARLAKSPDGRKFQLILRAMLSNADNTLRQARGEQQTFNAQGSAQTLAYLVDAIETAQQKLDQQEASPSQAKRPVLSGRGSAAPYQNLS